MLRHFCDTDGFLWFWRKDDQENKVRKSTPQNLFVKKDLYTYFQKDGIKDTALEEFFSKLEDVGAKFICDLSEIICQNLKPNLNDGAWLFWSHFFYFHLKRTPAVIERICETIQFNDVVLKAAQEISVVEGRPEAHRQQIAAEVRKNAIVLAQSAMPSPEVELAMSNLGLAIYKCLNPASSLVIGDMPSATAIFRLENNSWSDSTLFMPLTANIAVGTLAPPRRVEVIEVDQEQVKRMNDATTASSMMIAGRSEALIKSLSRNVT